jgi:TolA-binding protein
MMMKKGIQLRRLRILGQGKDPIDLSFGPGLNIVRGGSNTGKSHAVEMIDFALGSGSNPILPPEGLGYDGVMLTVELPDGGLETLCRPIAGGKIRIVPGQADQWPEEGEGTVVSDVHSNKPSLSEHLLDALGMSGKKVRKNAQGVTRDLSFRDLAHIAIIDETRIQSKISPIERGQYTLRTGELSVLKYLLTGVDDSKLSGSPSKEVKNRVQAQLEFIEEEIEELSRDVSDLSQQELSDQHERLEKAFERHLGLFGGAGTDYAALIDTRRKLRRSLEQTNERLNEIRLLNHRFEQLDRHYASDLERLQAIEEAGTFFATLSADVCPVCGKPVDADDPDQTGHSGHLSLEQIDSTREAARAESLKIEVRRNELQKVTSRLLAEYIELQPRMSELSDELEKVSEKIEIQSPDVRAAQSRLREITVTRGQVEAKLDLFRRIDRLEQRRTEIVGPAGGDSTSLIAQTEIPGSVRTELEGEIESLLQSWHFPGAGKVVFDLRERDIQIEGKPRKANGKGVRSVLHAAFSAALMKFCADRDLPHPRFLIMDSPLLTYRDPEPGDEADAAIARTDLKDRVFQTLLTWPSDLQIIIIENVVVPASVSAAGQTTVFSGKAGSGRQGLY